MSRIFGVKSCWQVFVTLLVIMDPPGVELLTRIAGLLLSAIAVQLVAGAIRAFVTTG